MTIGKHIVYSEVSDGLEILIKPKRYWSKTVIGIVGIYAVIYLLFNLSKMPLTRHPVAIGLDVLFSLGLIAGLSRYVYLFLLWSRFGEEVVTVSQDAISITKLLRFFGVINRKTFLVNNISSMCVDDLLYKGYRITFEHLERTEGIGIGLETADARDLTGLINKHIGK
ncbi:MAG: hypothetical protein A3J24_11960 [Deltaproteobacteria bacterium RIFCSPLOWO2_02_FULL_53_8]|nr:MAG: hypothetical protein A3J24_11960 [Deltaproteobacteria bacterium RIFCSPLOWO2_02_FULL_53_8]